MESLPQFEVREYQNQILEKTLCLLNQNMNILIELDCGLGKRFIQYSLIKNIFKDKKILLLLQASTSLYETFQYMQNICLDNEIGLIDSRKSSYYRTQLLNNKRVVLSLPQTLFNTIKKHPDSLNNFDIIIINEVDQIVKRMSTHNSLKQPYIKLFPYFEDKKIIGMSGTIRDNHYILDNNQLKIKRELITLTELFGRVELISMDSLLNTDLDDHINVSYIIATAIQDDRISLISFELEQYILETKNYLFEEIRQKAPNLYYRAKKDISVLFGPLPVDDKLARLFHKGYLTRKFLWSMSGETARIHLIRYGLDKNYINNTLPRLPGKFLAVRKLVQKHKKTVVLCSYLDTVNTLDKLITASGIQTIQVTGKIAHMQRTSQLNNFRKSDQQMVCLLSNVGERDLDIPEADLLIIFDLIRTTKTVYQKLKRSRGGECRILFYDDTKEKQKVDSVLASIAEKYPWSTKILPSEIIIN